MKKFLAVFGPGLLIAATGVGAGDLATSALAGSKWGLTMIYAVILGGVIKYVLNEGLARWQFQTGTTLIDGASRCYGKAARYLFLGYLIVWTFLVAAALMSASGVSMHALLPVFDDAQTGKIVFGVGLSLLGMVLVRMGGYQWFEKIMSVGIGLMMVSVFVTVVTLDFEWRPVPLSNEQDYWQWFMAVIGGVGGTVTMLCYGYWIREQGREGTEGLRVSRVDLALSYSVTVIFGICMVVIGSQVSVAGGGASLLVQLAEALEQESGALVSWIFKIGAFAAIFSSLLGVWQSVPYLFLDLWKPNASQSRIVNYKTVLWTISIIPVAGLIVGFARMQKLYAITGALFMPMLALTILLLGFGSMSGRSGFRNPPWLVGFLVLVFLFFSILGVKSLI